MKEQIKRVTTEELEAVWAHETSGWKTLNDECRYAVVRREPLIISHFKDANKDTIVIAERTEEQFLEHFNAKGNMLDVDSVYDIFYNNGSRAELKALNSLYIWLNEECTLKITPAFLKNFKAPKRQSITLGNSAHPVAQYGMTAKRIPSKHDCHDGLFYLEVNTSVVVVDDTHGIIGRIDAKDGKPGLKRLQEMVREGGKLDYDTKRELDKTNKYIGNDVMSLMA